MANIGTLIDQLHEKREAKRALENQLKALEEEYKLLEEKLLIKFDQEGTTKGAGRLASASVSESVVGNVTDWDKFHAFIKKTGHFHLLQRRTSDAAVRELFEQGKKVPGCEPFTKKRLNLRSGA